MLTLDLVRVPQVLGIYGRSKSDFPASMALMEPEAARAFMAMQKTFGRRVRVSDMFRTAEQSMQAMSEKSGVQPPGFSLHNFGMAIDVAVDAMLKETQLAKGAFDVLMRDQGWYCHRKDGRRGPEDWHYNYLGDAPEKWLKASENARVTSPSGEARIVAKYGKAFKLTNTEAQEALAKLKLYSGAADGKIGPRSQQAIFAFQRAWKLDATGTLDADTTRTLAYVTAEVRVTEQELALSA